MSGGITGLGTSALGFFSSIKTTLIASAVVGAIAFGSGYYLANDHVVTKVIDASNKQIADAKDKATKAQAEQDSKDWAAAKADYEQRIKDEKGRNLALAGDVKYWKSLVPHDPKCVVPAAAMERFNDPKLVGEDAQ